MKQVLQDLSKGDSYLIEAPAPKVTKNTLLIATRTTLISAGTERMLVNFGKANFIDKARQQPDKVKMVLEKVTTDGLITTVDAVKSKLGQPLPLGYCNVGIVNEVGNSISNYQKGDRVVSNGPHADIVRVAKNLCAKIPDNVSNEEAVFTVVASIGLQGIRLAKPSLGECFVVTGVGLIGLIVVQLLRAHGCRVLAIDYDDEKLKLAQGFGAEICNPGKGEDPISVGMAFSRGNGVDGVIITASTKSNDPVSNAARMSRQRGRIILVGVVGLDLVRAEFYNKELTFQVSCSYGPGRYDVDYEDKGNDYPLGFVRWTEQRNFEAILDMMSSGQLCVKNLVTHRFDFNDAEKAYDLLTNDGSAFGILLNYDSNDSDRLVKTIELQRPIKYDITTPVVGFVGAGNYASRILIPAFKKSGVRLHTISTSGGTNGVIHGKKSGFENATTETDEMIANPEINTIAIVTQHNSHAHFVTKALSAGKNVFVEKPLALTLSELDRVKKALDSSCKDGLKPKLMVGFNRRFSPQIKKMKSLLDSVNEPKSFIMTMNAGAIPAEHWIQDIELGGGRIIGEACHYIDLMRFLAGSKIVSVQARKMSDVDSVEVTEDRATITLGFEDGSFGTIHYFANGAASFPKERIEVFAGGKVIQLDNFIKMKGFGWNGFKKLNLWKQDKGQTNCTSEFTNSIKSGTDAPISPEEIFEVAKVSIEVAQMLRAQKD